MGLTRRKDGYYVEFPVLDDGKTLTLAKGIPGARIRRWKTHVTLKKKNIKTASFQNFYLGQKKTVFICRSADRLKNILKFLAWLQIITIYFYSVNGIILLHCLSLKPKFVQT